MTRSERLAKDGKIEVDVGTFELATVIPDCNAFENLRYIGTDFEALYNNCKVSADVYEDSDGKLFATIEKSVRSQYFSYDYDKLNNVYSFCFSRRRSSIDDVIERTTRK